MKKTLAHVDEPLDTVPAVALFGGIALYYAGHVGFRLRSLGTLNRERLAALAHLAGADPGRPPGRRAGRARAGGGSHLGLIAYEAIRFREARYRIRHEEGSM